MLENTLKPPSSSPAISRLVVIWGLFFLICFSLGYPTLNRYEPSTAAATTYASLPDTQYYASLVENGFMEEPDSYWRYRVLVPYVAKPFYRLFKGNIGSWNPIFFSLLIANSLFVASAALFLFLVGFTVSGSRTVGFISSLLCLSHFNVSNLLLAGLVDSGELFVLVFVTWLLLQQKWQMLPFVAVLAFLTRETTVVFMVGLATGWLIADYHQYRSKLSDVYSKAFYICISIAIGLGGIVLLRYIGTSKIVSPLLFGGHVGGINLTIFYIGLKGLVTSKALIYAFIWLLPLGLLGLISIPKNWLWATIFTTVGALFLIVLMNAGENAGRPLFNVAGPMLIVAAASYITKILNLNSPS